MFYPNVAEITIIISLVSTKYMKLKLDSLIKASQPRRTVIQMNSIVQSYKPVSDHKHNVSILHIKASNCYSI